MSAPTSTASRRTIPNPRSGVLILGARTLLRVELARLERRMRPMQFDANLSAQIDRLRAALEVLA